MRARLLLRLGEVDAARAMVQQVDSGSYTPALEDACYRPFYHARRARAGLRWLDRPPQLDAVR